MTTLVAGSYERFLFAHSIKEAEKDDGQGYDLPRAFSFPAHKGPVKCVAAAAPFIASGGADDTVHIYNVQTNADLGFLMNPGEGAITALAFYTPGSAAAPSHLLSGAADGSIAVWAAGGGWDCMKLLKGHKKEVSSLAVHPSGLLALSTARDDMLRMWNMTKGRSQYKTKIAPGTEAVGFSPSGTTYALLSSAQVAVHSMEEEGGVSASFDLDQKGICMAHLAEQVLLVGCEDGSLRVLDARSSTPAQTVHRAHGSRVRGVASAPPGSGDGNAAAWLAGSASSDGIVRLWDLRNSSGASSSSRAQPLCEASTSARLTCLCAMSPPDSKSSKHSGAPPKSVKKQAQLATNDEAAQNRAATVADRRERQEHMAAEAAKRAAELAAKKEQEREKRERKRAAAAAQHQGEEEARKGVVVKRKAETVIEFPDEPQRPKKMAAQKNRKKKGLKKKLNSKPFNV